MIADRNAEIASTSIANGKCPRAVACDTHKVNTTNKERVEHRNETVNQYGQGGTRVVNERREVRGVNCNCPADGARYSGGYTGGSRVSYRE